jgi:hypothetical protein
MIQNLCEGCRYWARWLNQPRNSEVRGECRRHSPDIVTDAKSGQANTRWPSTRADQFCGEFRSVPMARVTPPAAKAPEVVASRQELDGTKPKE